MKVYLVSVILSLLSSLAIVAMSAQPEESRDKRLARQQACADSYVRSLTASFAATH